MDRAERMQKIGQLRQLRNVVLYQTGKKAVATQIKIDKMYNELIEAGTTEEEFKKYL